MLDFHETIQCSKCKNHYTANNFYICGGRLKKYCKDCMKRISTKNQRKRRELKKLGIVKEKYNKNSKNDLRKNSKNDLRKNRYKITGWCGDNETYC